MSRDEKNNQILELKGVFEINWESLFIQQMRRPRLKEESACPYSDNELFGGYLASLLVRLRLRQGTLRLRAMGYAYLELNDTTTHIQTSLPPAWDERTGAA